MIFLTRHVIHKVISIETHRLVFENHTRKKNNKIVRESTVYTPTALHLTIVNQYTDKTMKTY